MIQGFCDAHSHVYGPYSRFPLASGRALDPPESPLERLETLWKTLRIERAVLIQGSAFGTDHRALIDAIAGSPAARRGVGILPREFKDRELADFDLAGLRAARVNWVKHLQTDEDADRVSTPAELAKVADRISEFGWHIEIHIDADMLDAVEEVRTETSGTIVIDHMGRLDASLGIDHPRFQQLRRLLDNENVWVKLSGADRLCRRCVSLGRSSVHREVGGASAGPLRVGPRLAACKSCSITRRCGTLSATRTRHP